MKLPIDDSEDTTESETVDNADATDKSANYDYIDYSALNYTSAFTPVPSAYEKAKNKNKRKEEKKEKTKWKNKKRKKKRNDIGWGASLLAVVGIVGLNLLIDSMPY